MNTLITRLANLTLISGLCLSVGVGCVTGEEDPEPNPRPDNPDVCEEINSGDVSGGATLSSDNCYQVNGALNVSSGTLVIEAGTTVFMSAGSSINLSGTGRIEADGAEDNEILIRGVEQERGYWAGIHINGTNTGNNVFDYVTIRHAGGARFTGANDSSGAIYVRGNARLSVTNSSFEQNAFAGIHVDSDEVSLTLSNTNFSENEAPLRLRADQFAQIDDDLTIADNDADHITMSGSSGSVTSGGTWPGYAYRVRNNISLRSDVTIAAGATLEFAQDVRLEVANDEGSLNIAGTEEAPVTLRAANGERGGWAGIFINNASSSSNRIAHALIADGGGTRYSGNNDHRGAIFINGDAARLTIEDTTFENNQYAALHISGSGAQVNVSASSFNNNEFPLLTRPNHIGNFSADLSFADNQHQVIAIFYSDTGSSTTLNRDATWPAFEVPVRLRASVNVEARLTLSPGSIFEVESNLGIDVRGGRLTADASEGDTIVFTGTEALSGYWKGIRFAGSRFPDNKLINVELSNAGSERWHGGNDSQTSLFVDRDSRVTVEDLTITGSGLHGVVVENGGELVGCTGLSISGSAGDDFFGAVADATACIAL